MFTITNACHLFYNGEWGSHYVMTNWAGFMIGRLPVGSRSWRERWMHFWRCWFRNLSFSFSGCFPFVVQQTLSLGCCSENSFHSEPRRRFTRVGAAHIGERAQITARGSTLDSQVPLFEWPQFCFPFQKLIWLSACFHVSVIFWRELLYLKRYTSQERAHFVCLLTPFLPFSRVNILRHWLCAFCPLLLLAGRQLR